MPRRPEQIDYEGEVQPATLKVLALTVLLATKNESPELQRFGKALHRMLVRSARVVMGSTMTAEEGRSSLGKLLARNRLKPRRPHGPEVDVARMNKRLSKMSREQIAAREEDFARDGSRSVVTPEKAPEPTTAMGKFMQECG